MSLLAKIVKVGKVVFSQMGEKRGELQDKNVEINAETERNSQGKITPRRALMYLLVILFAWELLVRPIISTYAPDFPLPPSMLEELITMSAAMFGFGF
ncbi:MAG: hypothetical protein IJU76_08380 [Desulfovibrionaceae bacterium]|nr:hypothetical protein [Desulfovibrionaceae bacterium]